jgi:hypothetical protein
MAKLNGENMAKAKFRHKKTAFAGGLTTLHFIDFIIYFPW